MNVFPPMFRRHPWASVLLICLFLAAVLVVRNLVEPERDPRLIAISQGGYPVTLSELNSFYSSVPDDQNAALIYAQAFNLDLFTNAALEHLIGDLEFDGRQALPEELRAKLAEVIATNANAWKLLYLATNYPGSRYPLDFRDGPTVQLSHLANLKRAVTLLSLEGLSKASSGDANQAFAGINAAAHATDSVREEPILISFLVRIACSALVAKRLEQTLNLVAFNEEQLRTLQERFAAAASSQWPARALAGERAFGLSFFIDRRSQRTLTMPQQGNGIVPSGLPGQLAIAAYKASGLMLKDRNYYLDAMATNVGRAEMAAELRMKSGPTPSLLSSNRFLFLSRMVLPALQRVLDRANEHCARMRVVETALAVERFRVAHSGALPETLQELTPRLLASVPLDPFDSSPLRYKKLPAGYVVYSIGADQQDNGGTEPPSRDKAGKRIKGTPQDLTFVVERP